MMDSKVHSHRLLFIAFLLIVLDQATKIAVKGFSALVKTFSIELTSAASNKPNNLSFGKNLETIVVEA